VSRGLGKMQRDILAELNRAGAGLWVYGLACRLHQSDEPSRAFVESVRRGVRTLVDRGLLHCEQMYGEYGDDSSWCGIRSETGPVCWLPEHAAPRTQKRIRGADVEQAIVELLRGRPVHLWNDGWEISWIERQLGEQFDQWGGQAIGKPRIMIQPRFHAAVHRAIHRLIERKQIRAASLTRFGKVSAVKLTKVSVDV